VSHCPHCGAAVNDEMKFCANCGTPLAGVYRSGSSGGEASGGGVVGVPVDLSAGSRGGDVPDEGPSGTAGGVFGGTPPAESTVSFAPAFEDEEGGAAGEEPVNGGAALIELDQVEGTAGRRMHDIKGEEAVTVGRGRGSDIFLDDVTVSRRHAEIFRGGGPSGRGSASGTPVP